MLHHILLPGDFGVFSFLEFLKTNLLSHHLSMCKLIRILTFSAF